MAHINTKAFATLLLVCLTTACMPALAARPARVAPGPSLEVRGITAVRTPSRGTCFDIIDDVACDFPVPFMVEAVFAVGSRLSPNGRAQSVGAGVTSVGGWQTPFLEYYQQRRAGDAPWGIGVRLGVPVHDWAVHALEVRGEGRAFYELPRAWTTTLAAQTGGDPNGTRGTALSLAHAEGVVLRRRYATIVPSLFIGIQHAQGVARGRGTAGSPPTQFRNAWSLSGGLGVSLRLPRDR